MPRILTSVDLLAMGWHTPGKRSEIKLRKLVSDSRLVRKGYGFLALDGLHNKGKDFIFEALRKGASAVFVAAKYEAEIVTHPDYESSQPIFFSSDFFKALGRLVSWFYGDPTRSQMVIGVTGTNGKTTIAMAFYDTLKRMGHRAAYIGTLGIYLNESKMENPLTTPDLISLHSYLSLAERKKIRYVAIEASSIGLHQGRLSGVLWNLAVFTNLSQDHLDYHQTMENYFEAKKILFQEILEQSRHYPKAVFGVIVHTDTQWGIKLLSYLRAENASFPIITLGPNGDAQLVSIEPSWSGYCAILWFGQKSYQLKTKFLGRYNLMNLATVFLGLRLLGFEAEPILSAISQLSPPPGRLEVIAASENRHVVIDYAHTPAALENLLKCIDELNPVRIIVIFGCGGERDKEKRPQMGKVASQFADFIILTNDNPRSEDPQQIINDIKKGITTSQYVVMPDREKAIRIGLQILKAQEVLVVAGKGHENYQLIQGKRIPFSDREVVLRLLHELGMR
ncbi:MAG: UDP-N-acetylmuramoyl-L-alanyl-D-glutamate--2,6-diaminopimelate ligase [Leptospiraceae bacterium]|nr:UDP-N-acetylmuramoyl-L-alanyl-D-glutamate--2,6-diaminopimelate ligase [Leptospiraceae bacterium]MDW8306794.1 UDP-N-acetylmuramoyl-L-alanyl-D-glutamate--2,6-diaminopimelate ligase [Leptospiraceae bacterium]